MLPVFILNCIASIADVVLKYPAVNTSLDLSDWWALLVLAIKCFTKVVDDGLNKCKYPAKDWSLSVPTDWPIFWNPVPCAWSCEAW